MRRVAARVHLWGGLVTGPLLLVLGLSGSALVFGPELEQALDGPPVIATTATSAPSLDAVVAAAVVGQPGAEPRALRLPARPDQPYRVELTVGGRRLDVAIDPSTLRVVDTRAPERSLLVAVRSLHAAFHAGRAGALLVGLLGVWLVVEGVTGLWLYGPWSGPRPIRRARGPSRVLHRIVGGGSLVVGVVVGLTGTVLALTSASLLVSPSLATGGLTRLDFVAERRSTILLTAHVCNWEWLLPGGGAHFGIPIDAVYKPIRLPSLDAYMREARSRFGGRPIPIKSFAYELLRRAGDVRGYGLVADQTPLKSMEKHWTRFLHQDTAFFVGVETIARFLEAPVVYVAMRRLKRGHYAVRLHVLAEPPYDITEAAEADAGTWIVEAYARKLEEEIRASPSDWLWVHNKWKYPKAPVARANR